MFSFTLNIIDEIENATRVTAIDAQLPLFKVTSTTTCSVTWNSKTTKSGSKTTESSLTKRNFGKKTTQKRCQEYLNFNIPLSSTSWISVWWSWIWRWDEGTSKLIKSLWKHSVYSKGRHKSQENSTHQSQENSTQVLSLLTKQLSVTIRAIQFEAIKGVNRNWTGRSVVN